VVAYSFAPQFVAPIEARTKLQTVRGHRRRHARVGEPIQLYTGMRTRQCRKLVDADPICSAVLPIRIVVDALWPLLITKIELDGTRLDDWAIEMFARLDGFCPDSGGDARFRMGEFWMRAHAHSADLRVDFDGVCLRWGWPQ
jgi:hypothetical protein